MSKHTPGPWGLVASRKGWQLPYQIEDPDGLCIVALEHHPVRDNEANARLIAAAPDLLEALKLCAAVCAGETMNKNGLIRALESAREAIAKAAGEQP